MLLISSKAEFPTDAIDMFLDSRIQKIVSVALLCCGMQSENELEMLLRLCGPTK